MNGVQVYAVVILSVGFVTSALSDESDSFGMYLATLIFSAPIYGRIFGWW